MEKVSFDELRAFVAHLLGQKGIFDELLLYIPRNRAYTLVPLIFCHSLNHRAPSHISCSHCSFCSRHKRRSHSTRFVVSSSHFYCIPSKRVSRLLLFISRLHRIVSCWLLACLSVGENVARGTTARRSFTASVPKWPILSPATFNNLHVRISVVRYNARDWHVYPYATLVMAFLACLLVLLGTTYWLFVDTRQSFTLLTSHIQDYLLNTIIACDQVSNNDDAYMRYRKRMKTSL